jgi:hypothetical protein
MSSVTGFRQRSWPFFCRSGPTPPIRTSELIDKTRHSSTLYRCPRRPLPRPPNSAYHLFTEINGLTAKNRELRIRELLGASTPCAIIAGREDGLSEVNVVTPPMLAIFARRAHSKCFLSMASSKVVGCISSTIFVALFPYKTSRAAFRGAVNPPTWLDFVTPRRARRRTTRERTNNLRLALTHPR